MEPQHATCPLCLDAMRAFTCGFLGPPASATKSHRNACVRVNSTKCEFALPCGHVAHTDCLVQYMVHGVHKKDKHTGAWIHVCPLCETPCRASTRAALQAHNNTCADAWQPQQPPPNQQDPIARMIDTHKDNAVSMLVCCLVAMVLIVFMGALVALYALFSYGVRPLLVSICVGVTRARKHVPDWLPLAAAITMNLVVVDKLSWPHCLVLFFSIGLCVWRFCSTTQQGVVVR